jgi:histidinol-phosphate/aromatic aminotransferase/cobyric acid decarboxylase-like protein
MESVLLSFAHSGVEMFESHANFVCFRHRSVREWERVLREDDNLLIRVYGSAGPLANVARVSVWSEEANARFLARLPALLNEEKR